LSLHIVGCLSHDQVAVGWKRVGTMFPYIFWCGKAFPYLFTLVTVLEDVRSKRLHWNMAVISQMC